MTVTVEVETRIARPAGDVFAAIVDVEHYPAWLIASGIVGVERLDPGPLVAGSRLRIRQTVAGRSTVLDGTVTVLAPGAAFGLRGKDQDGVTIEIDAVLAPDELSTRLRWSLRIGPAAPLPDVRVDGRAAGAARRHARPRGAQTPPGVRPPAD